MKSNKVYLFIEVSQCQVPYLQSSILLAQEGFLPIGAVFSTSRETKRGSGYSLYQLFPRIFSLK